MKNYLILNSGFGVVNYFLSRGSLIPGADGTFEVLENWARLRVALRHLGEAVEADYRRGDNDYEYFLERSSQKDMPNMGFLAENWQSRNPSIFRLPEIEISDFDPYNKELDQILVILERSKRVQCPVINGSGGSSEMMKVEDLSPFQYNSDSFGFAFYRNPLIFGTNILFQWDIFAWEPLQMYRWQPTNYSIFYDWDRQRAYFSSIGTEQYIGKIGILLLNCNYGHWFVQNFPILYSVMNFIEKGIIRPEDLIIITRNLSQFQKRIFELFNLSDIEVLDTGAPHLDRVRLDAALMPTSSVVDHRFAWSPYIGEALNHIRPDPDPNSPKYIFISRKDAGNRRGLRNEEELIESLRSAGYDFVPVEAARYSFDEQRIMFSNAKIVIGAHGSGLNNLMWAPRGSVGIELIHDGIAGNRLWFYRQINMAGYQYGVINVPRDNQTEAPSDDTMYIDPSMLVKLVRQADASAWNSET